MTKAEHSALKLRLDLTEHRSGIEKSGCTTGLLAFTFRHLIKFLTEKYLNFFQIIADVGCHKFIAKLK